MVNIATAVKVAKNLNAGIDLRVLLGPLDTDRSLTPLPSDPCQRANAEI